MELAITIVICFTVISVAAIFFGRKIRLSYKGIDAVVEQVNQVRDHTIEIRKNVGQTNGDGDLARMTERLLAESAETKADFRKLRETLDTRTHVTRSGHTEPEDLASYTQTRMHDVLNLLTLMKMQMDFMWEKLRKDYELPGLTELKVPEAPPTNEEMSDLWRKVTDPDNLAGPTSRSGS